MGLLGGQEDVRDGTLGILVEGGGGRDLVEVGSRNLFEVGLYERRILFVYLGFLCLFVSAPHVLRSAVLLLCLVIALVEEGMCWLP